MEASSLMILIVVLGRKLCLCVCVCVCVCVCARVSHIHLCVHQDFIHLHFIKNKCGLLIPHIDYPERPQKWKHNNLSFETNVSRKGIILFLFFFFKKKATFRAPLGRPRLHELSRGSSRSRTLYLFFIYANIPPPTPPTHLSLFLRCIFPSSPHPNIHLYQAAVVRQH